MKGRWLGCVAALSAVSLLAGCDDGLTAGALDAAFAPAFARTLVRQEKLLGQPGETLARVAPQASCLRGGDRMSGAGDDWLCTVLWVAGDGTHRVAAYDVQVRTDGCYEADGPAAVGGPQLTAADGSLVTNPLYEFDGCFAVR